MATYDITITTDELVTTFYFSVRYLCSTILKSITLPPIIMTAKDLINDDIPPIKLSETADKALGWMDEFRVSHLPVIQGKKFIGMIGDSDLYDLEDASLPLSEQPLALMKPMLVENMHAWDVLKVMSELGLDVIAVVDEQLNYQGAITIRNLMEKMAKMAAVREPGGIIVVEVNTVDYSLSQIAQIVEGNDAKVLSVYVAATADPRRIEVTIKTNRQDLSRILQTFTRYNYTVIATFHESKFEEDVKRRYAEFMNYISI
jgi:CBS domain-containing protein